MNIIILVAYIVYEYNFISNSHNLARGILKQAMKASFPDYFNLDLTSTASTFLLVLTTKVSITN